MADQRIANNSVDSAPESGVANRNTPASALFAYAIGLTRAYAHRLQTHTCDDTCRCCPKCYQVPGLEICDRLCVHADGGCRMTNPHAEAERIVNEVHYAEKMARAGVPEHLRGGLVLYLVHHIQPGHFLTAVLENDLKEALGRADENSRAGLFNLVSFLYNDAPSNAWGNPEHVRDWLRERGR